MNPTLYSMFFLHCRMINSIASVTDEMIHLVLSHTSSLCIVSNLEPLPMVILTLLAYAEIVGPPRVALDTVDIQNV